MLNNPENQGRTLDSVDENDGPWYPQCWPFQPKASYIEKEMRELVETKLPPAELKRKDVIKEMSPHLAKIAREQQQQRGGGARKKKDSDGGSARSI